MKNSADILPGQRNLAINSNRANIFLESSPDSPSISIFYSLCLWLGQRLAVPGEDKWWCCRHLQRYTHVCVSKYSRVSVCVCSSRFCTIVSTVVTFRLVFHLPFTTFPSIIMCSKLEQKKISKNAINFYCTTRRCHVCIARTHTHIYHLWATPTQRIYCASLGHISDAFVSQCQWLLDRQASVDLPTTPIELSDYWFPTKLCVCVCKKERETGRYRVPVCVCVAFVILAILMSLKTISEKVANDVRAKMELEVFRVFMQFVAAAWTISATTNNVQQQRGTYNNRQRQQQQE